MVKDEANKKKMFNFVKRLKENTRRNQLRNRTSTPEGRGESSNSPTNQTGEQRTGNRATVEAVTENRSLTNQPASRDQVAKPGQPGEASENNCSICLRENNEPALCNECFHCFCFPCIEQWSQQSNQCPVCRREYSVILYNIRSETEYDQLAVSPRRQANEFEIILPLNNLTELDRRFVRLLSLPMPGPNQMQIGSQLPMLLPATPLDTEQRENLVTFTVTNFNTPDQNGNQVIQRTFFQMIDPNDASTERRTNQLVTNQFTNVTPSTSLEANSNYRPAYNPLLVPETNTLQQPTIVFNPTNDQQPYRNLDNSDPFMASFLNDFSNSTSTFNQTARTNTQPLDSFQTFFDRIFEDFTQIRPSRTRRSNLRTSFPFDHTTSPAEDSPNREEDTRSSNYTTSRRTTRPTFTRRQARRRDSEVSNRENQDASNQEHSNRNTSTERSNRSNRAKRSKGPSTGRKN